MENQPLRYHCPKCQKIVRVDESVMGKHVDCPHCGQPFLPEAPVAHALAPGSAGEGEADEPLIRLAADDESELMIIRPAIFRRHCFGMLFCVLLLIGGVGLILFGGSIGSLFVVPGLYYLVGGSLAGLIGVFYLLKWWLIAKTHKLTVTTERSIYRSGIIRRFTSEVRHNDVRNIKMEQNFKESGS